MWSVIVGLILAIILMIVLSPVKIWMVAADGFEIKIKYLFFKLFSYNSTIKEEKSDNQKECSVKEKNDIKSTVAKITNCTNNYDKLVVLVKMLKSLLSKFQKLLKHTMVKNFNFNITVSGVDAADTAIKYGNVCSIVYPLSNLLSKCVNFTPENISVFSDFNGEKTNFYLEFVVSVRLVSLIGFAVSSVFDIIKLRMGVKTK